MGASFVPARGLQVRMLVAIAVNLALLAVAVGLLVLAAAYAPVELLAFVAIFAVGANSVARRREASLARDGPEYERAAPIVQRLGVLGDCDVPDLVIESGNVPLAWTSAIPRRRARVHLTLGLFDALDDRRLASVIGHELTHLINRDAMLMTVLAGPGVTLLRGMREVWTEDYGLRWRIASVVYGLWCVPVAAALVVSAGAVSRQRELSADRGAAMLTGSPSALASALATLDDRLRVASRQDLRKVAAGDVFHIVPANQRERRGLRRIWATHPPLQRRLDQLHELERALQR